MSKQYTPEIELEIDNIKQVLDGGIIDNVRGTLFELLVYKYLIKQYEGNKKVKVMHDKKHYKQQIDILIKEEHNIKVVECKINIHNKSKVHKKIRNKIRAIKKYPNSSVETILVVYVQLEQETVNFLKQKNIEIIDNFKQKIDNSRLLSKDKRKLVFNFIEAGRAGLSFTDDFYIV